MKRRLCIVLAVASAILTSHVGCKPKSSAFPLTLQAVRQLDPTNTMQISFEERRGEIFVSVIDRHGDSHIHKLIYEGTPKQQVLKILKQKQAEFEMRR